MNYKNSKISGTICFQERYVRSEKFEKVFVWKVANPQNSSKGQIFRFFYNFGNLKKLKNIDRDLQTQIPN